MRARAHGAHLEPGGLGRSLPAFGHHDWRVHAVLAQLKVLKPRSLPVQRVARGAERGRGRPLHTCTVVSTASLVHNHGIARCVTTGVSGGRAKARTARQYCTHLIFLRAAADIAKARRGRGRTDAAHCNRTGARARPSIWRRSLARCSLRLVACPRQDAALFGRRLLPADGTGELSVSSEFTALWPLAISTAADRSRRSPADQPSGGDLKRPPGFSLVQSVPCLASK